MKPMRVVVLLIIPLTSACSSPGSHVAGEASSSAQPPVVTTTVDPSSPSPTAPTAKSSASISAPAPTVVYSFTGTANDGSTESGSLHFWPAQRVTSYQQWDGWPHPDACPVDADRDVYVPVDLTVSSTTEGFPVHAVIDLQVGTYAAVRASADSGSQCVSGTTVEDNTPLLSAQEEHASAGAEVDVRGYIVVPGYFSPAFPQGQAGLLGAPSELQLAASREDVDYGLTVVGSGINQAPADEMQPACLTMTGTRAGGC